MKKVICVLMVLLIMSFSLTGCKKKSGQAEPVKTAEQLKAEVEQEINEDNMEEELRKLEKEIEADTSSD